MILWSINFLRQVGITAGITKKKKEVALEG